MKFLVDEDLPRSTATVLQEIGYEAVDVRDVGLRGASDEQIAGYAKANNLCLITADGGFANIRQYPPADYAGLVVLDLPPRRLFCIWYGSFSPTLISFATCLENWPSWPSAECESGRHEPDRLVTTFPIASHRLARKPQFLRLTPSSSLPGKGAFSFEQARSTSDC